MIFALVVDWAEERCSSLFAIVVCFNLILVNSWRKSGVVDEKSFCGSTRYGGVIITETVNLFKIVRRVVHSTRRLNKITEKSSLVQQSCTVRDSTKLLGDLSPSKRRSVVHKHCNYVHRRKLSKRWHVVDCDGNKLKKSLTTNSLLSSASMHVIWIYFYSFLHVATVSRLDDCVHCCWLFGLNLKAKRRRI